MPPDGGLAFDPSNETRDRAREAARARLNKIEANRVKYNSDFATFSGDCLKIRPETGDEVLLRLNAEQQWIHERAEEQRERTGKVRLLVLKGRKQGVSTYVGGRFYWKTSRNRGLKAFIFTHDDKTTTTLFNVTKRFHEGNPHAPGTDKKNDDELSFAGLDSSYGVGTAGAAAVGRGDTIQLLHGSEVAFWPNGADHAAGILKAVPNAPGTEVWLESTANGIGNLFYNMCMAAERGQGEYELLFLPWFRHATYRQTPPTGWTAPTKFAEYGEAYELDADQVYWAYITNADLAAADNLPADEFCWRFQQEFPATVDEAFRASRSGSFIGGTSVLKARKTSFQIESQAGLALVFGCDFATGGGTSGDGDEGGDSNAFIDRRGRIAGNKVFERFRDKDTVSVANKLQRLIDFHHPDMCFLDVGGGGANVYDILCGRGYKPVLTLVAFGGKANDERKYKNKRAEIWGGTRDWLADPGGADIPDDDALDGDLTAPTAKEDLNRRIILESKKDIRKRLSLSPDMGDALALTFSENVVVEIPNKPSWRDELYATDDGSVDPDAWKLA